MTNFRTALGAFTLFWAVSGGAAFAAEFRKFDRAHFEKAQADGQSIVVDIAAWWCPTCRAQEPALKKAASAKEFENMVVYRLDYDGQKKDRLRLGVQKQSTLIGFKGAKETARSLGETDPGRITELLKTTVE